ncbi:glycosyltransferase family 9 protein [Steroidobacter sp. S1-65]|uniref:Glycosyltransferase family 9 protein n=1 Tax=Steroidobacter gossypii TaxID=2805490 RepID=A0ABS1X3U4_9GAMM|nr:glycosyltransferase family 9 protein [Steroidobacter gossypii]MBM0107893.1 glycosyltransferase family 9 protein [Steroidobacter gossypii]
MYNVTHPPASVCILRLSAIGDTCHVLPVIRTLQRAWPATRFTWVIGRLEAKLFGHLPDIEFIVVDKRENTWKARARLNDALRGRTFDVLMHMQLSLRASILSTAIKAKVRLGFDRSRARELQWLFTNTSIAPASRQHVMDGLFGFAEKFDVYERLLRWDIPLSEDALAYAQRVIPEPGNTLLISPCSSHQLRNWRSEYYAEVADYAVSSLGMRVILCGGPSEIERRTGAEIVSRMKQKCENTIGQDTLLQFFATLERATVLITPDSGPAHMGTAAGIPVIGLYAATNPARSGPYLSRQWCVDKYDQAARRLMGRPAAEIPWTTKIERPGVMDLITPDDVIKKLHAVLLSLARQKK